MLIVKMKREAATCPLAGSISGEHTPHAVISLLLQLRPRASILQPHSTLPDKGSPQMNDSAPRFLSARQAGCFPPSLTWNKLLWPWFLRGSDQHGSKPGSPPEFIAVSHTRHALSPISACLTDTTWLNSMHRCKVLLALAATAPATSSLGLPCRAAVHALWPSVAYEHQES